jgi:hypothetical protein
VLFLPAGPATIRLGQCFLTIPAWPGSPLRSPAGPVSPFAPPARLGQRASPRLGRDIFCPAGADSLLPLARLGRAPASCPQAAIPQAGSPFPGRGTSSSGPLLAAQAGIAPGCCSPAQASIAWSAPSRSRSAADRPRQRTQDLPWADV